MRNLWRRKRALHVWPLAILVLIGVAARGQDEDTKPVPILTGSTSYFTRVSSGQTQNAPLVSPLLLMPLGDKWLIEAKGNFSDTVVKSSQTDYTGTLLYGLNYAQVDYIANRFVTVTGGRFITPFGIFGERLAPDWIRALQSAPLSRATTSGSALGGMLRGGFSADAKNKVDINYAVYFSTCNTNHLLATDRTTGGRINFFFPGPRVEIGTSFQQLLQGDRSHAAGLHGEWQPNSFPLTLRSEFVRTSGLKGSAYWIESVYRLSQVPHLHKLELVGRGQQFYANAKLTPAAATLLGLPGTSTNQGDFGLNYYLRNDVRASASFGKQFAAGGNNANIWMIGITYRFLVPLGSKGGAL